MMILIDGQKGLRTADSKEFVSAVDSYLDGVVWRAVYPPGCTAPKSFVMHYGYSDEDDCTVYISFMRRPL